MNIENVERPAECATAAAALVLAADDELGRAEWLVLEHHLEQCAECRALRATFALTDRGLLQCAAELDALTPTDSALRARLIAALGGREHRRWSDWIPIPGNWEWVPACLATLSVLAVATWTVDTPSNLQRRPAVDTPSGGAEVVRLQLSLVPVGDPFLDGSQSESLVVADVAVSSDGRPTGLRLAE